MCVNIKVQLSPVVCTLCVCVCVWQALLRKVRRRELYPFIGESVVRQGNATKKANAEWKGIVSEGLFKILKDEVQLTAALQEHAPTLVSGDSDDGDGGSDRLREMLRFAAELVERCAHSTISSSGTPSYCMSRRYLIAPRYALSCEAQSITHSCGC